MANTTYTLPEGDEALLQSLFGLLKDARLTADPYAWDGAFARQIRKLPKGLRAMAATHFLDVSLGLDDIGWHFQNFGEENHVRETEMGLRELGIGPMADLFHETYEVVRPHLDAIVNKGQDYYECMEQAGLAQRLHELARKAWKLRKRDCDIYAAWVRYARSYPENVFRTKRYGDKDTGTKDTGESYGDRPPLR